MWIFTKNGHLSLGQRAGKPNILEVHAQLREEMDSFVPMLDEIGGQHHEVQETVEGDYRFVCLAQRSVVAQAVAQLVTQIDHGKFVHSVHLDTGMQQGYFLWLNRAGLQVAMLREPFHEET